MASFVDFCVESKQRGWGTAFGEVVRDTVVEMRDPGKRKVR